MTKGPLPVDEERLRAATQPSISQVLDLRMRFQPEEALRHLLDGQKKPRGFRNAVRAGFWTWMLAPTDHHLICDCIYAVLQVTSDKTIKRKFKKYRDPGVASVMNQFELDSKWTSDSISYIRMRNFRKIYYSNMEIASKLRKNTYRLERTVHIARFIHILNDIHIKYGRKYVQPSASKARELISEMDKIKGIKTNPTTLLRRSWQKQRASIAFIYAASTVKGDDERSVLCNMADKKFPFLHHDDQLREIAGRARWFTENILLRLRPSAREKIPEFAFPNPLQAIGFDAVALTEQQLEVVREKAKDGRNGHLPDPWTEFQTI